MLRVLALGPQQLYPQFMFFGAVMQSSVGRGKNVIFRPSAPICWSQPAACRSRRQDSDPHLEGVRLTITASWCLPHVRDQSVLSNPNSLLGKILFDFCYSSGSHGREPSQNRSRYKGIARATHQKVAQTSPQHRGKVSPGSRHFQWKRPSTWPLPVSSNRPHNVSNIDSSSRFWIKPKLGEYRLMS
jgi:hypothetical protein